MKQTTYLDYNASTPLRPRVIEAMVESFKNFGNPSAIHAYGRAARSEVESARDVVAKKLDVLPAQVVFTSGGTEANNFCIQAALKEKRQIYISAIEHESILRSAAGAKIIPVTKEGVIDLEKLDLELSQAPLGSAFVSVMFANNETGICQPVQKIAEIVKRYQGRLHCDAVTAFTKVPFTYPQLGADYITVSSHKIGGPKGVGVLVVRNDEQLPSLILGGGQEKGHRAGTENVSGIAGFAKAIEESAHDPWDKVAELRNHFEEIITGQYKEVPVYGKNGARLPNTSSIGMPGVPSIKQLVALDLEGFAVSAGSACSSGKSKPSHVLKAMGVPEEESTQALRISLGWNTTRQEVEEFAKTWINIYERFKNKEGKE